MNCKRENTNEITCPHCDYEFEDSYENIPSNSDGEICWIEECQECNEKFNVSFDCRNVDDGYSTSVIECDDNKHKFKISNTLYESQYKRYTEDISIYSRIEICTVCDKYKFTPVKIDGSDFTKKELLDFKIKKRLAKKDKIYHDFDGIKTGIFEFTENTDISLKFKEPEGNVKIWVQLCRWFISKGFKQQPMPDYLRRQSVSFKKDWLECDVSLHNYAISINFYQNEILKDRKRGDGRYEYGKYKILTPSMKTKIRASLNMVKNYLVENGFNFNEDKTDLQKLLNNLKVNDLSEWNDPETIYNRDNQDRDKKVMKSGDLKYFYDYKTLKRGTIWWNNGNQWYVMCNGVLNYTSHYSLFDYSGEPIRKPLNKDQQIQRLYTELTKAEKDHKYDRCKSLWKMLESYKLYNVWSYKHDCWWSGNNSGYTKDKAMAGVYTHENIINNQSYYNDGINSKAILIDN